MAKEKSNAEFAYSKESVRMVSSSIRTTIPPKENSWMKILTLPQHFTGLVSGDSCGLMELQKKHHVTIHVLVDRLIVTLKNNVL